ncbi:MAG: fibronectin type III domain-containing protein, partial [Verrucomicrobiota bacterium]
MAKVKLGLKGMTENNVLTLARLIVEMLGKSEHFPDAEEIVAELSAALEDSQAKAQEYDATENLLKQRLTEKRGSFGNLRTVLTRTAEFVQSRSGGRPEVIASAGVPLRKEAAPVGLLPAPRGVRVLAINNAGELTIKWGRVRGAVSYQVQLAIGDDQWNWVFAGSVTKTKLKVTGLQSGVKYWFRVAALNTNGLGDWSQIVPKMVP